MLHEAKSIVVDPRMIVKRNPPALVVNRESYRRMEGHFSPEILDPPLTAWVKIVGGDKNKVLLLVDGMTRAKYCADHVGQILAGYPDFDFLKLVVKDGTTALLRNEVIMVEGRVDTESLTMAQYLRAIIPTTIEHTSIVSQRIAAHLINAWRSLVGIEIYQRYSAIAALNLLSRTYANFYDETALRRIFDFNQLFFSGETAGEHSVVLDAIVQMGQVIHDSSLEPKEVAESAFILIGEGGEIVGGEDERRRQVFGMLHTPKVEAKLKRDFPSIGQRETAREKLGERLLMAYQQAITDLERQEVLSKLNEALDNPRLTFEDTLKVLSSPRPIEKYRKAHEKSNFLLLRGFYLGNQGKRITDLSPIELSLLTAIGRREFLTDQISDDRMATISRIVSEVALYVQNTALPFLDILKTKGSKVELTAISDTIKDLPHYQPEVVSRRLGKLRELIASYQGGIPNSVPVEKPKRADLNRARLPVPEVVVNPTQEEVAGTVRKNELFSRSIDDLLRVLDGINISPDELGLINHQRATELLRRLGRLIFRHPDIVTILQKQPNLMKQKEELKER